MWSMARDDLQFRLRIPEKLKQKIEISAGENNRSMTSEIISRLERSYENDETIDDMYTRLEKIERMVYDHDEHLYPMKYDRD